MARQRLALLLVPLRGGVVCPDLQDVVATARDEPTLAESSLAGRGRGDDAAGGGGGGPGDRVDTEAVGGEGLVLEGVVLELEDGDVAIGGGACKQAARLVRGPRDHVDRGLV